ncbi:M14 family metallopeptidase [Allorhodopirellula heiligendammensis]|uniref:Zinc carboxypeptidase n=1 Tax=Allorhodopirellula heiligendammensis TaxID=2714739 RepID=A0A5C6BFD3_9BACT|nr:M14 family metallopeptidase [Allorhodopirellula heiligendammensis]TWU09989.1 Zinc carboxypeptidase [Allorhodopirellula heiligendammensis]
MRSSRRYSCIVRAITTSVAIFMAAIIAETASGEPRLQRGDTAFESHNGDVSITSDFPGGRMKDCLQISDDTFTVTIAPESTPINDSAWYAFQVQSQNPKTIRILLHYVNGSHRYEPKISRDGENWQSAADLIAETSDNGQDVELEVPVDSKPLWIAGQELLGTDEVSLWSEQLTRLPYVERQEIGQSVQGRPVEQLTITECDEPNYVYIIARQHPPEVTGAIGMLNFVDTIAGSSDLAQRFRKRFAALVVPTVNPDGVHQGHWRTNANGVDLNRDWAHFTQPETRAVRDRLLQCRRSGDRRLCLFVDFHSTYNDIFYIPAPNPNIFPAGFTQQWFSSIQNRFPSYEVSVDDNHNAHRSTSKAWVNNTLGVTAVTYEFGDETDREMIQTVADGAAEEMMRLLLELPSDHSPAVLANESEDDATKPIDIELVDVKFDGGSNGKPSIQLVSGVVDGKPVALQ